MHFPVQRCQQPGVDARCAYAWQAVYSGMESVSRGTEAVQQELEMILAQMAETAGPGQQSRPPASKRAVAALPKVRHQHSAINATAYRAHDD